MSKDQCARVPSFISDVFKMDGLVVAGHCSADPEDQRWGTSNPTMMALSSTMWGKLSDPANRFGWLFRSTAGKIGAFETSWLPSQAFHPRCRWATRLKSTIAGMSSMHDSHAVKHVCGPENPSPEASIAVRNDASMSKSSQAAAWSCLAVF